MDGIFPLRLSNKPAESLSDSVFSYQRRVHQRLEGSEAIAEARTK